MLLPGGSEQFIFLNIGKHQIFLICAKPNKTQEHSGSSLQQIAF